jgi:glycosyltransferase involved in cell wall biosynthesis
MVVVGALGRGGAERQALLLTNALSAASVETELVALTPPYTLLTEARFANLAPQMPHPGAGTLAQIAFIQRRIAKFDPDAVISFLAGPSIRVFLGGLGKNRRHRVIAAERGNLVLGAVVRHPAASLLRVGYLRAADAVVVNSPALGMNLMTIDRSIAPKIAVIPNIVMKPAASDSVLDRDVPTALRRGRSYPVALAVGSFQRDRNYDLLAAALPRVRRTFPDFRLVIVGRTSGPECAPSYHRFASLVQNLGVESFVDVLGELPNAEDLMTLADVVVVPSSMEGSSNALAEALAAGSAIATTPVGDAEHVVGSAAAVSAGWSSDAFAVAVITALRNRDLYRAAARFRATSLTESRSPDRIVDLWHQVAFGSVAGRSAEAQQISSPSTVSTEPQS